MEICDCLKYKSTYSKIHVLFCLFPNVTLPILLFSYTFKPFFSPHTDTVISGGEIWMPVLRASWILLYYKYLSQLF